MQTVNDVAAGLGWFFVALVATMWLLGRRVRRTRKAAHRTRTPPGGTTPGGEA